MAKTPKKTPARRPAKKAAAKKPATKAASGRKTSADRSKKPGKVELKRTPPEGLFAHIWEARRGLRASFEAQLKQGITEERLLAYVAFACLMAFVAGLPSAIDAGRGIGEEGAVPGLVAGRFVAVVIFGPLFLYGLAGASHWVAAQMFGGEGSYPAARLALFWALVLGVPIGLMQAIAVQAFGLLGLTGLTGWLGGAVFLVWLWFWTSFLAIAEGFSRAKCYLFALLIIVCVLGVSVLIAR